jgi:hypothetical protein
MEWTLSCTRHLLGLPFPVREHTAASWHCIIAQHPYFIDQWHVLKNGSFQMVVAMTAPACPAPGWVSPNAQALLNASASTVVIVDTDGLRQASICQSD